MTTTYIIFLKHDIHTPSIVFIMNITTQQLNNGKKKNNKTKGILKFILSSLIVVILPKFWITNMIIFYYGWLCLHLTSRQSRLQSVSRTEEEKCKSAFCRQHTQTLNKHEIVNKHFTTIKSVKLDNRHENICFKNTVILP